MKWTFANLFTKIVPDILCWISQSFTSGDTLPREKFLPLYKAFLRVQKTRGTLAALNYVKGVRGAVHAYLASMPVQVSGIGCTRDGIPRVLGPLIPDIRSGSPEAIRQILTVLSSTRALKLGRQPDISPIISPASGGVSDIGKYSKSFWRDLGYLPSQRVPRSLTFRRWHLSTKSGPNGHALWTALADLSVMPASLLESVKALGGEALSLKISVLFTLREKLKLFLPVSGTRYRKISYFPDREAKVRTIAVIDYFSQAALRPLHKYLFSVLRRIRQDCTFDQGAFKSLMVGFDRYWSFDLTAATDRFPIELIAKILEAKLPTTYVKAWVDVMVGYPFDFEGTPIRYAVGNPMGAYSSWASFALAHHYVVYECCKELRIPWSTAPYCLLGDDIVIADQRIAELYLHKVTQLGVEISMAKSHPGSPTLYEFAKRLVYKGVEITPFPISALPDLGRSFLLTGLLIEWEPKGWITSKGIPSAVREYYRICLHYRSAFAKQLEDLSYLTERTIKIVRGLESALSLNEVARRYNVPLPPLNLKVCEIILRNVAVQGFLESWPDWREGKPLGQLALELTIAFTDPEILSGVDPVSAISSIPILGCYGQIEEMYLSLIREAPAILTTPGVDWPLVLKTMALPLSDEVFVARQSFLTQRASAVIGKKIVEHLLWLASPTGRSTLERLLAVPV